MEKTQVELDQEWKEVRESNRIAKKERKRANKKAKGIGKNGLKVKNAMQRAGHFWFDECKTMPLSQATWDYLAGKGNTQCSR